MAIFISPIASSIRKRMAGVVFKRRLGSNIMSSYQPVVKNPATPARVLNKSTFRLAIAIAINLKSLLFTFYPAPITKSTRLNKLTSFFKLTLANTADYSLNAESFSNKKFGNGTAFDVVPVSLVSNPEHTISIAWDIFSLPPLSPNTGTIGALIISLDKNYQQFIDFGPAFSEGSLSVTVSEGFIAGEHVIVALQQKLIVDGVTSYSRLCFMADQMSVTINT